MAKSNFLEKRPNGVSLENKFCNYIYGFQDHVLQDSSQKINLKEIVQILRIAGKMTKAFIENKNVCLTKHLHLYRRPDFFRYIFEKVKKAQGIKYS